MTKFLKYHRQFLFNFVQINYNGTFHSCFCLCASVFVLLYDWLFCILWPHSVTSGNSNRHEISPWIYFLVNSIVVYFTKSNLITPINMDNKSNKSSSDEDDEGLDPRIQVRIYLRPKSLDVINTKRIQPCARGKGQILY